MRAQSSLRIVPAIRQPVEPRRVIGRIEILPVPSLLLAVLRLPAIPASGLIPSAERVLPVSMVAPLASRP
eukprot:13599974-Heterocapsa_arctica.AAC.1